MINYSHARMGPSNAGSNAQGKEDYTPLTGSRKKVDEKMMARTLTIGQTRPELGDNKITTSKYNCVNFIPLNLIEQFSKIANIYFLVSIQDYVFMGLNEAKMAILVVYS